MLRPVSLDKTIIERINHNLYYDLDFNSYENPITELINGDYKVVAGVSPTLSYRHHHNIFGSHDFYDMCRYGDAFVGISVENAVDLYYVKFHVSSQKIFEWTYNGENILYFGESKLMQINGTNMFCKNIFPFISIYWSTLCLEVNYGARAIFREYSLFFDRTPRAALAENEILLLLDKQKVYVHNGMACRIDNIFVCDNNIRKIVNDFTYEIPVEKDKNPKREISTQCFL